jgi:8-oxo-dGTP pyrophosphatase MutT (NUDIX family)
MKTLQFDPSKARIDGHGPALAVPADRLSAEGLRQRFASAIPWSPEFSVEPASAEPASAGGRPPVPAAVLVPIVVRDAAPAVLLTMRTAHLHDHAGQVSFPGGRVDAGDADPVATALRETEEEVGLARRHVEVLGCLPEYRTGTGFLVTPVVALVHPPFTLVPDEFEVAEIFEAPLDFLMDGANHERRSAEFPPPTGRRSFYAMPYGRHFIWGATAAMLRNLYHFLRAG